MTALFRVVLVLVSIGTFALVMQRIRQAKMQLEDSVFWVLLCAMFILFALFPMVPDTLAKLLGIYSTANFLFLFIIFILLMKVFSLSMHLSVLEKRLTALVQEEALREAEERMASSTAAAGMEKAAANMPSGTREKGDTV